MSKESILNEISSYESLVTSANSELVDLNEKLATLEDLLAKFNQKSVEFNDDMRLRKQKVLTVSYMASNVKCARRYFDKMDNMINADEYSSVSGKVDEMELEIRNIISQTNGEIYSKKQDISNYESRISELKVELERCTEEL